MDEERVSVAGTEATTCGVKFSDRTGTRVNLPDVFDIEHTEYSEGKPSRRSR